MIGEGDDRWKVLANGSLSIERLEAQDSGRLYCAAINAGGALLGRVHLVINTGVDAVPAFFQIGPANQTLPIRSPALFQCQSAKLAASGALKHNQSRPAAFYWTRNASVNDVVLNDSDSVSILPSGWLHIDHLQMHHSGRYTCWTARDATDATTVPQSSWTATLSGSPSVNDSLHFN